MTLVIRATETITTPRPGATIIPSLSVTGAIGRWHALGVDGAAGASVSAWKDLTGSAFNLTPSGTVTATVDEASGARAVKIAGTGLLQSVSGITLPNQFTLGVRVYLTENPAPAVSYMAVTSAAGTLIGVTAHSFGGFRAYGNGTTSYNTSGNTTKPSWATIVATFDGVNQLGKIALNGGAVVSGAQTWTSPTTTRQVRLTGNGTTSGIKFRQVVILDHIATDTEMGQLASDLAA